MADDQRADAGEIGRAGETYRRIRITSVFGNAGIGNLRPSAVFIRP
jgi:hypothetical protein